MDQQPDAPEKCGMSIQEMKDYLALCLQGERTIPQRKILLAQKQEALRAGIRELQDSVAYIDWKQNFTTKCSPASGRMRAISFGWKNRRKAGVSIKSRRRTARYRLLLALLKTGNHGLCPWNKKAKPMSGKR